MNSVYHWDQASKTSVSFRKKGTGPEKRGLSSFFCDEWQSLTKEESRIRIPEDMEA
jgi:hypothetical protein